MLLLTAVLQGALAVAASPATAWVRQRTDASFAPFYWRDPRQVLEVARPPAQTGVTSDELWAAAEFATRAWSHDAIACTSVNLTLAPEMTDEQIAKRDERNRIAMRVGAWCRDPDHPTDRTCRDSEIIAVTTLFNVNHPGFSDDGRLLEADIELNAVDWEWATLPDPPTQDQTFFNKYDLASALTHEMGHFIGLDHTCTVGPSKARIDDQGNPVPDYMSIPDAQYTQIREATMYPIIDMGQISARSLTDDDTNAACAIYPAAALPLDAWGGMGGCTTAASPAPRGATGLVLALLGVLSLALARLFRQRVRVRSSRNPSP